MARLVLCLAPLYFLVICDKERSASSIVCLEVIVCNVLNCFITLFVKHLGQRPLYYVCYIINK